MLSPGLFRLRGNSPVQAEAEPLPVSFLQVLRMVHFLRQCTMRKTCKKSFRSPKATMLRDYPARLNKRVAPTVLEALQKTLVYIALLSTKAYNRKSVNYHRC